MLVREPAAGLTTEGIRKDDVVTPHSPNTNPFPVVLHATTAAGGTVTPLSPPATPDAVDLVRRQSGRDIEVLVRDTAEGHRPVLGLLGGDDVPTREIDPAAVGRLEQARPRADGGMGDADAVTGPAEPDGLPIGRARSVDGGRLKADALLRDEGRAGQGRAGSNTVTGATHW